jgi:putative membrane protein
MAQSENSFQTLRRMVLQWLITSLAIFAAFKVVEGIRFEGNGWEIGIVAMIYSIINVLIRPILTFVSCSMIVLTLGLFTFVINAGLLLLTSNFATSLGINFHVDTFWAALWGSVVISLVSFVLNLFAGENQINVTVKNSND